MLGLSRFVEHETNELRSLAPAVEPQLCQELVRERAVHVIAPELAVAARRAHLKDAVVQHEDRDVEGASAEIVHRERSLFLLLEPVCQRRGGGLVDQAQHFEARKPRRVFGRLPLRIVEIGRDGDHGAADTTQLRLRLDLERAQDLGADFDRRHFAFAGDTEANRVRLAPFGLDERIGAEPARLGVVGAPSHEALRADDCVARILARQLHRAAPHDDLSVRQVGDHARDEHLQVAVCDGDRTLVLDVGDQ